MERRQITLTDLFFNIGESADLAMDALPWDQVTRVVDKRDGSMINTVFLDGELFLKSKKSFDNKQTRMANEWLDRHPDVRSAVRSLAAHGFTETFELTSPANRIVVAYDETEMRLLHVRHNVTGEYDLMVLHHLATMGIDLAAVNGVETRVKSIVLAMQAKVDGVMTEAKGLDRKDFAVRFQKDPDFGLLMSAYPDKSINYQGWFKKHVLKQQFGLNSLPGMPLSNED